MVDDEETLLKGEFLLWRQRLYDWVVPGYHGDVTESGVET